MKKYLFTLVATLVCLVTVNAGPVDVETARSLGLKFMKYNTRIGTLEARLSYTAHTQHGQPCFYVFSVLPKGFVIVSADDRAKPILGYSTESNFTASLPEGLMTFFDNYKAGFDQMMENNERQTAQAAADWKRLAETGRINNEKLTRAVEPLCASIWNQTDLYNSMAPVDSTSQFGYHCKSGCVANAMSQIMRYWEWPRKGESNHSYQCYGYNGTYYGELYADFEHATYRYELMPDFLDFASPKAEVDAVALLESHAGIGVDMMYGPSASGAFSFRVFDAFRSYFRYDPDMLFLDRDDYNGDWVEKLHENLDGGMPLYYASAGDVGGHAYVLDGYDQNGLFHLNWGWQGFDNGYFDIDGFYLTFYSFPYSHQAIFNLHPNWEYEYVPKAVASMNASQADGMTVNLHFEPTYQTNGGVALTSLDSIVVMRDGVVVKRYANVSEPQITFTEVVPKNATYYYTVYAVSEQRMSKVVRDTIMVGEACDVRFDLHDAGGNGWDMSYIAVLDEDGKVSLRVGLEEGAEYSRILMLPRFEDATFFWSYDNWTYSHHSCQECSYEIYDWNNQLIVASNGTPTVGSIKTHAINCETMEIKENSVANHFIYPNPATNCIHIALDAQNILVFNALGQQVYQGTQPDIDVSAWQPGAYFVRIISETDGEQVLKFMKE